MTAHKVRRKRLAHGTPSGKGGGGQLVRIMVSLPPDDFRRLAELARQRGQPVAAVIREAVWAYLLPIEPDEATSQLQLFGELP